MPYIKHRGARRSGSIKKGTSYEDHGALCYEGLSDLMAHARRLAEEKFSDPKEAAKAISDYVESHEYPGLKHMGGVAFVDDDAVRSTDEVITEEEYERLRLEISQANQEYRTRKAAELSKNNDPSRRAAPEHELFGWRTRVWITSYSELDHHVPYMLGEQCAAYLRVRMPHPSGVTAQLIDIYHATDAEIDKALFEGTDWAEAFADLLALSAYGLAQVTQIVGTTVPYCRVGESFQIATFGAYIFNSPLRVHPNQIESANLDPLGRLALRHLRDGLSANQPTAAFAAHWNALERLAEDSARAEKHKRIITCKKCGDEREVDWNLKEGFEAMYTDAGIDPSKFDEHRGKRGAIQHGSKLRGTAYLDDVIRDLPAVQRAAIVAVAKRVGIVPGTTVSLSTSRPVTIFRCRVEDGGSVRAQFARMTSPVSAGSLPQRYCGIGGRAIRVGHAQQMRPDPLAIPPVQR